LAPADEVCTCRHSVELSLVIENKLKNIKILFVKKVEVHGYGKCQGTLKEMLEDCSLWKETHRIKSKQ
jgi:hypothetical protein